MTDKKEISKPSNKPEQSQEVNQEEKQPVLETFEFDLGEEITYKIFED